MNESLADDAAPLSKDRSAGLVIFGILTILLGALCAMLIPLMLASQAMAEKSTGVPGNYQAIIPAVAVYGVLAVALVWLGIGSIRKRRWARALLLIGAWIWLVMGVLVMATLAFLLPQIAAGASAQGQMPAGAKWILVLVPLIFMGIIFLIVPGILVFFYRSPHVKATFERLDPTPCWTDRCPLPVLALSLMLGIGAVSMIGMALTSRSVFPFFGLLLSGPSASAAMIVMVAVWAWCARALYRLDPRGWLVVFAVICLFAISHMITYSFHDITEVYGLMGYTPQQREQIAKYSFLKNGVMAWSALIWTLPMLGYLLYVKKYFRPAR